MLDNLSIEDYNPLVQSLKDWKNCLQYLSVLELDYLKVLTNSEITSREEGHGMTSLNLDEEKERLQ